MDVQTEEFRFLKYVIIGIPNVTAKARKVKSISTITQSFFYAPLSKRPRALMRTKERIAKKYNQTPP